MSAVECRRCEGEGLIANDEDQTSWKYWRELPPGADLAVRMGLVYPVRCPFREGKGSIQVSDAPMVGSKPD